MFFFTLGGAEANENAIKMAREFTGRHKIITRYRSYHGATAGAMTLTGDPRRWANEPCIPGVVRVFDPDKYRSHLYEEGDTDEVFSRKCLDQLEETLMYEGPHTVAAVVIESVTGTNGLIVPDGYLQGLRALCDEHGILLVCDEVMAGLGRCGEWFAVDYWDVVPDIITMAKGLTSAYLPLGAVAISGRIAEYFKDRKFLRRPHLQCPPDVARRCRRHNPGHARGRSGGQRPPHGGRHVRLPGLPQGQAPVSGRRSG